MLFAVVDYIKYKLQKGIYSPKSIHEHGAVLAEPSLLPKLEKFEIGDFLFVHTADSILSWAVMYYTGPTIWSHVAHFGKDGYLCDCTTHGVIEHHISDYFDEKSYILVMDLSSKVSEDNKKKGILWSEQIIGFAFLKNSIAGKITWTQKTHSKLSSSSSTAPTAAAKAPRPNCSQNGLTATK